MAGERTCVECGEPIVGRQSNAFLCGSTKCERDRLKRSEAYKKAKQRWRDKNPSRGGVGKAAHCEQCGAWFTPTRWIQKYCSHACGMEARRVPRDDVWRERRRNHRRRQNKRRRAVKHGAHADDIDPDAIYERDGWRCGICGCKVDSDLPYPHSMSVSLDHIIPLSLGGSHTKDNVQCAHLRCNISKGNRGQDQLLLIG